MSVEASSGLFQNSLESDQRTHPVKLFTTFPSKIIACWHFSVLVAFIGVLFSVTLRSKMNWLSITSKVTTTRIVCGFIIVFLTLTAVSRSVFFQERDKEHVFGFPVCAVCPETWLEFSGKCYYFSEYARNWTFSQAFCTAVEARLAQFETWKELDFLKRYAGASDHWIGVSRESSIDNWEWTDGTDHNSWFIIKGDGECACLNDKGVSSARSETKKKWICNKLLDYP
ncbi:C-type lectin domain family 2 member F-like [Tenrec ecaudatus]|uniref:C-type lectin domain family 2 member F-like n=1 Tax=Tenrec ecaudatus TaxID=94439 RepID=UPI003F5953CE